MEYKNDELGVSFTVPEKITVRAQLRYKSVVSVGNKPEFFERLWLGVPVVSEAWKCDAIKPGDDLDTITDKRAADVAQWAGLRVYNHMDELGQIPKN